MLSHRNFIACLAHTKDREKSESELKGDKNNVHLSYLPMPHIFERFIVLMCIYQGCKIYFYSGDILKLKDDLAEVRPTIFPSVPRLFIRFHDLIKSNL